MKEYIERAKVLDILDDLCVIDELYNAVKDFPAADVAPVRHGRWDENGRCTLCGGHAPFWAMASTYYKSPWCHKCGARMDKEDEHEVS